MIVQFLMFSASNIGCWASPNLQKERWLSEKPYVAPVNQSYQSSILSTLNKLNFRIISERDAQKVILNKIPDNYTYFYFAKGEYFTDSSNYNDINGVKLSSDIYSNGIAYVTSFRMTNSKNTKDIAIVIGTKTALSGVVSLCNSAQ